MHRSSNAGCIKKVFGGCFSLFLLFMLMIYVLSSIDFPEFDISLSGSEKSAFRIEMDSTSNEKMIISSFSWKFVSSNFSKKNYNLTFRLLEREVNSALKLINRIGNMNFRDLGLNPSLQYADPETRAQFVWSRIYNLVYTSSLPQLKTISKGFNNLFRNESMDDKDRVLFVVSFVQNIKYDRPGGALDLMAPIVTLAKQFGDCDTKAILLYVLLEKMGIDCAMMWSQYYKHAMLGVKISTRGDYKKYNGKRFYFLETTYPGWAIGVLPPDFKNKRFWFISEIDVDESGKSYNMNFNRNRSTERPSGDNKPSPAHK